MAIGHVFFILNDLSMRHHMEVNGSKCLSRNMEVNQCYLTSLNIEVNALSVTVSEHEGCCYCSLNLA